MGSFAADHVVTDPAAFEEAVPLAVAVAREDWLVTLGIDADPRRHRLRLHPPRGALPDHPGHHAVAFVEKPSIDVAHEYVDFGRHRWNAGMFVARPRVLLDLLARCTRTSRSGSARSPPSRSGSTTCGPPCPGSPSTTPWPSRPRRPAGSPSYPWIRVGRHRRLRLARRPARRRSRAGSACSATSHSCARWRQSGLVVPGPGRLVALVGLDDVVVVDTPDALLVTSREHAQDVKEVVSRLRQDGRADLT